MCLSNGTVYRGRVPRRILVFVYRGTCNRTAAAHCASLPTLHYCFYSLSTVSTRPITGNKADPGGVDAEMRWQQKPMVNGYPSGSLKTPFSISGRSGVAQELHRDGIGTILCSLIARSHESWDSAASWISNGRNFQLCVCVLVTFWVTLEAFELPVNNSSWRKHKKTSMRVKLTFPVKTSHFSRSRPKRKRKSWKLGCPWRGS